MQKPSQPCVLYAFRVPVNTSMTFTIAGYKATNLLANEYCDSQYTHMTHNRSPYSALEKRSYHQPHARIRKFKDIV